MIGQLMLSLSILIVLHEMGHFVPAKWFGTRVEKFYLFFDPWFSLVKKKIGETEYGIGWLPLGGYVKISGMVDESFDTQILKEEPKPWEFRSKPAWQRLVIMLGGVTMNFLLGFFLYGMVLFWFGEEYLPAESAQYGIHVDSIGYEMGLRNGDKILRVGDQPFEKFNPRMVIKEIILNNARTLTVEREGQVLEIPIEPKYADILSRFENKNIVLFQPRVPFVASQLRKDSPAERAGIQPGDRIIGLDSIPTPFFDQFFDAVRKRKAQPVTVHVVRGQDTLHFNLTTTPEGAIGVYPFGPDYFFEMKRQEYSFAAALPAGVRKGWTFLTDQVKAFGQIIRGNIKASESLGSFISIGQMFGATWDWERFWLMTAFLSLILAFINLLPIPALDGGHVLFLLFEVLTGRKPSDKFLEYATMIGFVIIIALMVYAIGLDISRLF